MHQPTKITEESAFNFAAEYLKQISDSLRAIKQAKMTSDIDLVNKTLEIIFDELSIKTSPEEDDEIVKTFSSIYKLMNSSDDRVDKLGEIISKQRELERTLRKMIQNKGMGLPGKNDPGLAVGRR